MSHFARIKPQTTLTQIAIGFILTFTAFSAIGLNILNVNENGQGTTITIEIEGKNTPDADSFALRFSGGKEVSASSVTAISPQQNRTAVIICIDRSGSMGSKLNDIREALQNAVTIARPHEKLELLAFGSEFSVLVPFSDDPKELAAALASLTREDTRAGNTVFYETIATALSHLSDTGDTFSSKRIIVITDGKDEGSTKSPDTIISHAKSQSVAIDTIGYGTSAAISSSFEVLRNLTEQTNGVLALPANKISLENKLNALLDSAAPKPSWKIAFNYEPSIGGPKVRATLFNLDGEQSAHALKQKISAPASAATVSIEKPPGAGEIEKGNESGIWSVIHWLRDHVGIRIDLKILIPLLAALTATSVVVVHRHPMLITHIRQYIIHIFRHPIELKYDDKPPPPPEPKSARKGTAIGFTFDAPKNNKPSAVLKCIAGRDSGNEYRIESSELRIGSDAKNDLVIAADDYVSGRHASITFDSGSLYLRDLGSRNGTTLNGTRLARMPMALSPGDEIRVGRTTLRLEAPLAQSGQSSSFSTEAPVS